MTAPMGIYFTAFLYFMDHVIRAEGWQATVGVRMSLWIGAAPYLAGLGLLFFATTWWQVLLCATALVPIAFCQPRAAEG